MKEIVVKDRCLMDLVQTHGHTDWVDNLATTVPCNFGNMDWSHQIQDVTDVVHTKGDP